MMSFASYIKKRKGMMTLNKNFKSIENLFIKTKSINLRRR